MEDKENELQDWSWDEDLPTITVTDTDESIFSEDSFLEVGTKEDLEEDGSAGESEEVDDDRRDEGVVEDAGAEEPEGEEGEEEAEEEVGDSAQIDEDKLFRAVAEDLTEKGYDLGFDEDEEVTEEKFFSKFSEFADRAVKDSIDMWKDNLPDEAKNFNRFVASGGDPNEYYKMIGVDSWRSFDVDTESGAEQMVRHYLTKVEGLEGEELEDEIGVLSDADRLQKKAKLYYDKFKSESEKAVEEEASRREQILEQRAVAERNRLESLSEAAATSNEVNGYKFDAKKAYESLTRNTVKVGDKYVPSFSAKFQKTWVEEPEKLLLLAHLLESDFDFSPIARSAETKATKKTRDLITKGKQKQKSRVSPAKGRPVWEIADF